MSVNFLSLCLLLGVVVSAEVCDKTKCRGPLSFYEDLKCKPVYEKEGDCCAVKYDCSHVDGRSVDKCYINNTEYDIGEHLRDEDRPTPCELECICTKDIENRAIFECPSVLCNYSPPKPGCYWKKVPDTCCGRIHVCPEPETFKCEVDGSTYFDGQEFSPQNDPNLLCVCAEGYKGENVAPFCNLRKDFCKVEMRQPNEIRENCTPVYYHTQKPSIDCTLSYRCQNKDDIVIPKDKLTLDDLIDEVFEERGKCQFGNLTLRVGEQLKQGTRPDSVCVKCVCEVPPIPTCVRLSDCECEGNTQYRFL